MQGRPSLLGIALLLSVLGCDEGLADPLAGREFVSESVEGHTLVPDTTIRMSFRDGEISASAGCNSMGGPYDISDGQLIVDGLWATEAGCPGEGLHEQDEWLASVLTSRPTLSTDDPRFTLRTDAVSITLLDREVAEPDLELVGPAWKLDGFLENGGASFGDWPTTALVFSDDGSFAIESGCPVTTGRFAVEGSSLRFSEVSHDLGACPSEPAFAIEVATAVLADGTVEYEVDSTRLTLTRGERGLWFNAPRND